MAAPPIFKVVFTFSAEDTNQSSWSEVYYNTKPDQSSALLAAKALAFIRLTFLHKLNSMVSIRISQLQAPRAAYSQPYLNPGTNITGNPFPASTAIILKLASTGGGAVRHLWMRGNSEVDAARSSTTGQTVFGEGFLGQLPAFFNALQANSFIILKRQPPSAPGFAAATALGLIPSATGPTCQIAYFGAPLVFPLPEQVILSRFSAKDQPGLNGIWNVLGAGVVAGGIFAGFPFITVGYVNPGSNTPVAVTQGQLRPLQYQTSNAIDPNFCFPEYLNSRQTKGPISGSRGARRAARRLRTSP